ncbi:MULTISPECIES: LysR family transcriptional regulator [Nonlabens]|uniref:LysR family transcriptional regulator n=1 Tax=Nonlabens TaxID=363408 RepID=UPI000CF383D9|nr:MULTISPECIES: LysR family transcriptional regulator [Nonlabens]MEE2802142.1 LysR family transcriptional regulator [Bacteroidota bacterium]PQJ13986.1 LysR family transcriptional regulator [Nonlabens tegetincola]
MHYTLHQLQIFIEIVKHRSITRASESLFLTQPAVSIQLKKFQEQFPLPLTEVVGRQLYVTDFGEEIARTAINILEQIKEMEHKVQRFQGKLAGTLKISVVSTGKYLMPYFLSGFIDEHPQIEFKMDVTNKQRVIKDLEENLVDFALVSVLPEHLSLKTFSIFKNELFLVGNKKRINKLKEGEDIFMSQPLLYRESGSATRNAMEDFLKANEYPITKRIELTSNEALKQAVIAGLGFSIMPKIGIKNALEMGLIETVDYPGLPIETKWNLVWLKNKTLTPVAQAYIDYLSDNKSKIIDEHFKWVVS